MKIKFIVKESFKTFLFPVFIVIWFVGTVIGLLLEFILKLVLKIYDWKDTNHNRLELWYYRTEGHWWDSLSPMVGLLLIFFYSMLWIFAVRVLISK